MILAPAAVRARAPSVGAVPTVARREGRAMGSPLRFQVAGVLPAARVDAAWAEVAAEFEAAEEALSRFRASSEIHRLRLAGGVAIDPSRRLAAALVAADRARRVTGGRFDPRVLGDLERLGSTPLAEPHGGDGRAGLPAERPDLEMPLLRRAGRRGRVDAPIPVDFGGIGKGLALRWAARRAARALGEAAFLLEAGGDIVGGGTPGLDGWRVGIEDPRPPDDGGRADGGSASQQEEPDRGPEQPVVVLELPRVGGAVATSSIRRARWQAPGGRVVHHLIDPRTGEPGGDGLLAVTVTGPDPAWAEVWSKSLFLEGGVGIAALARSRGLAAWWVTVGGAVEMTPAARERTVWVAGEA